MAPDLQGFLKELLGGEAGPMKVRFVLQPIMAAISAIRSGLRDIRTGRGPGHRGERIVGGWHDVGRVFLLAVALDLIYQALILRAFRPLEAVVVALAMAIVPYLIFRGVVHRLLRRRLGRPPEAI